MKSLEYQSGDRRALVSLVESHWDSRYNKWEVQLYIGSRLIEVKTIMSEQEAQSLAEDFVNIFGSDMVMLNERTD